MVLSLPYDIWLAVTCFLSVRDILNLQTVCYTIFFFFSRLLLMVHLQTCRQLRKTCESRYVWLCVLQDILSAIPLPNLRHSLSQLSADELKKKAIIAARIAHLWNQETVIPQKAYKFECDSGVVSLHLLPGGKWMIIVHFDGTLVLHDFRSELPKVRIVDRTLCDENLRMNVDLRLWVCQSGEILAILKTFSGEYYNGCV